jgi:hypothetical protein
VIDLYEGLALADKFSFNFAAYFLFTSLSSMFSARAITSPQLRVVFKNRPIHFTQHLLKSTLAMTSISDAITKDHRELEQYYNEVVNAADLDHQERYGNQFT